MKSYGFRLWAIGLLTALAGCVYVAEHRGSGDRTDVVLTSELSRLEPGMTYELVLRRLGPPLASSARRISGIECRYLTYPTRAKVQDGDQEQGRVRLVFQDKALAGWGEPLPDCPGTDGSR